MTREKNDRQVKLMLSDTTLRAVQDAAMQDDRSVGDWLRVEVEKLLVLRAHGISLVRCQQIATDCESS